MLTLTRKSDYALIALTQLARAGRRLRSARELSDASRVPLPILMNIMKTLCRHQMVTSVRGARGGYRLALDPGKISLRMVVSALEGPVRLFQCAGDGTRGRCEQEKGCPITAPAKKVSGRLLEFLDGVTLAEIAEEPDTTPTPMLGLVTINKE